MSFAEQGGQVRLVIGGMDPGRRGDCPVGVEVDDAFGFGQAALLITRACARPGVCDCRCIAVAPAYIMGEMS